MPPDSKSVPLFNAQAAASSGVAASRVLPGEGSSLPSMSWMEPQSVVTSASGWPHSSRMSLFSKKSEAQDSVPLMLAYEHLQRCNVDAF